MTTEAIQRYLEHLRVERRVSAHTLTAYGDALARLVKLADEAQRPLKALQSAHIQRFAAQLHGAGLGARSIALTLSGWRGFYRWWSLQSDAAGLANNPVDGVRYEIRPNRLRIVSNGHVDSSERVLDYATAS